MAQIVLIAPNQEVALVAEQARQKYLLDMDIFVGLLENGVKIAKKLNAAGSKVFICRGMTAAMLKESFPNQVVELQMSVSDAVNALEAARKYGRHVLILSFANHIQGVDSLSIMDLSIEQITLSGPDDVRSAILGAKGRGVEVIVGGAIQCAVAKELGMPSVFIRVGMETVQTAYHNAGHILQFLVSEERKAQEFETILNCTKDGFITVNQDGCVTLMSKFSSQIVGIPAETALGQPISKIAPELHLTDALSENSAKWTDVITINDYSLMYTQRPLTQNGKVIGAIAILRDIRRIQADDNRVRQSLYNKGLSARYTFSDILGRSSALREAKKLALEFSKNGSTVLITGETGTGKELFAQSIHNAGLRKEGPFVAINCASLPEGILESELFGYVDGAFTGARKGGKAGVFEMAKGGTLFLDEIGEISLRLQTELLRVLQERSIMRLGDDRIIPIDVRIIAATNRNLVELIRANTFRMDLFFRLNVLRLTLPPLHARGEDVLLLGKHFLAEHGFDSESIEQYRGVLMQYAWPGNIRELSNLMERIAAVGTKQNMGALILGHIEEFAKSSKAAGGLTMERVREALMASGGRKAAAAKALNVDRSTLWRFLEKNGLNT